MKYRMIVAQQMASYIGNRVAAADPAIAYYGIRVNEDENLFSLTFIVRAAAINELSDAWFNFTLDALLLLMNAEKQEIVVQQYTFQILNALQSEIKLRKDINSV